MRNGQTSESVVVQELLEQLGLSGVCISLDALHTQKAVRPRAGYRR